jgi:hypothetical protein
MIGFRLGSREAFGGMGREKPFERKVVDLLRGAGFEVASHVRLASAAGRWVDIDAVVATSAGPVLLELQDSTDSLIPAEAHLSRARRALPATAGELIVVPELRSPWIVFGVPVVDLSSLVDRVRKVGLPTAQSRPQLRGLALQPIEIELRLPLVSIKTGFKVDASAATGVTNLALVGTAFIVLTGLLGALGLLDQYGRVLTIAALVLALAGVLVALFVRLRGSSPLVDTLVSAAARLGRNLVTVVVVPIVLLVVAGLVVAVITGTWRP